MAFLRRLNTWTLFKCVVTPTLFLCVIFKRPVFQWIALGCGALWLAAVLTSAITKGITKRKHARTRKRLSRMTSESIELPMAASGDNSTNDLFLIRQINYRITEQLKGTYPMVSWLWVTRPTAKELCGGGTWRIRVTNADPFNHAEVQISTTGQLFITMMQTVQLKDASEEQEQRDSEDLKQEELLERTDVKSWYRQEGGELIATLIDELNTQGHKQLLIHEDGEVVIGKAENAQVVEVIQNFPVRMVWDEFTQLLREDDITATVKPDGLALAW